MTLVQVRDVPAPPPDRALPMLPTALKSAAMEEILGAALEGVTVHSCIPCYIRYKPATNCIVQYRLSLDDPASGEVRDISAHVKLYPRGRAERVWSGGVMRELAADAAAQARAEPELPRAAHLQALDAVLQIFPVDVALPALSFAASGAGRARVLAQVQPKSEIGDGGVELLRYKPARKALLRYDAAGGAVYAKLYARDPGRVLLHAERALVAGGVRTARPLAYMPSLGLLAYEGVFGAPLRSLRGTARFMRGVREAGEALARLHAVPPIADLVHHSCADEGAALAAAARTVGVIRPDLAREATAICAAAVNGLGRLAPAATTVHGDFYDDQVLVADDGVVLLDLDSIACGHPLLDVGNFLAHLSVDGADDARSAFLESYRPAQPDEVPLLEAAALLKLTVEPFRRLEPDWPEAVERRLRLAAARLAEIGAKCARRIDPALPQLAVLLDPTLVGQALAHVYAGPTEVVAAAIVKHKAGRRCLLRYELAAAPTRPAERLYGKTFASERGPRVHANLRAIAEARACGRTVLLPEPVAYLGSLRLLLQREVGGVPARVVFLQGDVNLAVAVAEALAALHSSAVQLERRHTLADELAALRGRVERLAIGKHRALDALARIETASAYAGWRRRPVHRDFYHDQLLVHRETLGVLDFDDAVMSEPAVDVANFLAHLDLLTLEEPTRTEPIGAVAAAFRARAQQLDPQLDPLLIRLLESATLLRLACIHELRFETLLGMAEALLPVVPRDRL